jgi:protein TonB
LSAVAFARAGTFGVPEIGAARSKVRLGRNPRPEYPRAAREAGWAGTVILQVVVLPNGTVGSVTLRETSGHSALDEAALAVVPRWHFVPAMEGNVSFESVVSLPIRFDLKDAY